MSYQATVLADLPLGYWPLDDHPHSLAIADASGHAHTGTLDGTNLYRIAGATPLLGAAMAFASGGSHITVPGLDGQLPVGGQSYTIECWAWMDVPPFGTPGTNNGTFVFWGDWTKNGSGPYACNALMNAGDGDLRAVWGGSDFAWTYTLAAAIDWTLWHHIAVTCDGTTDILYIDGTPVAMQAAFNTGWLGHNFQIGAFVGPDWVLTGTMQHVAIYDHALTHERLAVHYAAAFPYQEAVLSDAPEAYWPLTESAGTLWADISGHDYTLSAPADPAPGVPGPFAGSFALDRTFWTATDSTGSLFAYTPANAIDGDSGTSWVSATDQVPGMWLSVDMGSPQDVNRITLEASGDPTQFPLQYDVLTSLDGMTWTIVASASGDTSSLLTVDFPQQHARHLRVQTTAAYAHWWAVAELRAYLTDTRAVRFRLGGAISNTESGLATFPFTVDAWINIDGATDPRGYGNIQPILFWGDPTNVFAPGALDRVSFSVATFASPNGAELSLNNSAGGTGAGFISSDVPTLSGDWHHLALTMDGSGNFICYVDGVSRATGTQAPTLASPSSGIFSIGGIASYAQLGWCDLAYVALYPTVLTSTRIAAHHSAITDSTYRSAVLADSPSAFWPLQDT